MSEYEKMCQIQLELQKLKQQNVVVVVVVFLSHAYITKISHIIISKHSDKLYVHKIYLAFHWAPLLTTHRAESWRDNKILILSQFTLPACRMQNDSEFGCLKMYM